MTDRDLGRALLNLDAATLSGKDDTAGKTAAILQRDRFRLRVLTWSTMAIWLFALLLIFGDLVFFGLLFPLQAKYHQELDSGNCPPRNLCKFKETCSSAFTWER